MIPVMLRSKQHFVPGGWTFYQAEMNWTAPENLGFDQVVDAIVRIRQANPRFKLPTDRAAVSVELENYTERRLRETYGDKADQWLIGAPATVSAVNPLWRPLRQRAVDAVAAVNAEVKKAVAGVGLITEWLGSGLKPCSAEEAQKRAAICQRCKKNENPNTLQSAYGVVADGLHLLMQAKSDLKLATQYDSDLHSCKVCDCDLKLKVWAPGEHVLAHTSEEVRKNLDPDCWILTLQSGKRA
jgi:hypothetical protein